MEAGLIEFFNIVFRFIHIVAAIMWIGNSLLFTWMEINLLEGKEDEESLGYLNMLHGGGIFHLQKRVIKPDEIPARLHIFKWQSYTTWISGFILLVSVFYTRGGTLLLDPSKSDLPSYMGWVISLGSLILGWFIYDLLWRSPIGNYAWLGLLITFAAILFYASWLETVFNGRAVYLQMGAMMGTWMSANVRFHIIVNQDKMMAALRDGKPHDLKTGKQAKIRSWHNHYITFPVIFLMLSAHFPSTYGSERNIAIAAVVIVCLIIIKHMMNSYQTIVRWKEIIYATFIAGTASVYGLMTVPPIFGDPVEIVQLSPEAEAGKQFFSAMGCQACHLPQAGTIAPSLHGLIGSEREFVDGTKLIADEAYIRDSIMNSTAKVVKGFAPTMPPYASVIQEEQLNQLVAYILSLSE
ncbi:MAG: urate hydroxylase PuuD [Verrucomicrobia bacterium]|nr:urate hydroxylase PuuD [Verrucomicrobiota bacterium]MDA1066952.1 urate hydroxylase PuuD [Verrucomicrobiota bacterium]